MEKLKIKNIIIQSYQLQIARSLIGPLHSLDTQENNYLLLELRNLHHQILKGVDGMPPYSKAHDKRLDHQMWKSISQEKPSKTQPTTKLLAYYQANSIPKHRETWMKRRGDSRQADSFYLPGAFLQQTQTSKRLLSSFRNFMLSRTTPCSPTMSRVCPFVNAPVAIPRNP